MEENLGIGEGIRDRGGNFRWMEKKISGGGGNLGIGEKISGGMEKKISGGMREKILGGGGPPPCRQFQATPPSLQSIKCSLPPIG